MVKRIVRKASDFFNRRHASWKVAGAFFLLAVLGVMILFFIWFVLHWKTVEQQTAKNFGDLLRDFATDYAFYLLFYTFIGGLLFTVGLWLADKVDPTGAEEKLRRSQINYVKLLEHFEPLRNRWGIKQLYNDRSIYNAIIATLDRLTGKMGKPEDAIHIKYNVFLLLCSPALDYDENPKVSEPAHEEYKWGEEFKDKIEQITAHKNIKVEICHLPSEPMLGFKPMEDFLSVLAYFITNKKNLSDFQKNHDMLKDRTNLITERFRQLKNEHPKRFVIHPPMFNIPFQIVLVFGHDFHEVVVSFAGRDLLESGTQPRGFFSSDPDVVNTFQHVYSDYVAQSGRLSFVPRHTRSVIDDHSTSDAARPLKNYLGIIPHLEVADGCFSPAFGNSSKFTSWVISKVLTKNDISVLDIGSGTGVLALIAQKTLQQLGAMNYKILAVESDGRSLDTLRKNCPVALGIEVKHWRLCPRSSAFVDVGDGNKQVYNAGIGQFNVIIADLPFVDVKEDMAKDPRFFDPKHEAHEALFKAVASNNWLANGGKLITAFSSLGGPDDVLRFERLIEDNKLKIVQRVDFHEADYLWIVHVIMKKDDVGNDFWWSRLNAREFASTNGRREAP